MKKTIYLKISNKTNKLVATTKLSYKPLMTNYGQYLKTKYYPTRIIKLNIEIPDEEFDEVDKEITLKIENSIIASKINIDEIAGKELIE